MKIGRSSSQYGEDCIARLLAVRSRSDKSVLEKETCKLVADKSTIDANSPGEKAMEDKKKYTKKYPQLPSGK